MSKTSKNYALVLHGGGGAGLESCGLYVAGRGSAPNSAGYVELDASIMHGPKRTAGTVAALPDFVNPVQVALRVT